MNRTRSAIKENVLEVSNSFTLVNTPVAVAALSSPVHEYKLDSLNPNGTTLVLFGPLHAQ